MKIQHKIVIYTQPIFDKQYLFIVYELYGDDEKWICSGNATKAGIKKELNYWFNK